MAEQQFPQDSESRERRAQNIGTIKARRQTVMSRLNRPDVPDPERDKLAEELQSIDANLQTLEQAEVQAQARDQRPVENPRNRPVDQSTE